jgi:uncharacterized protein (TIGR00106 family)
MVLLEFSMYPLGKGESVGAFVARCLRIVQQSGLTHQCHSMGTILEGEFDEVMAVVKQCFAELTDDCDRVECLMKLDYRKGHPGELNARMARIEERLGHSVQK